MKQNTITALKKVVQEMVQKEVTKQINKVVKEITNPTVSEANGASYYTEPAPKKRKLAKDPVLNKILNETQGGISGDAGQPAMEPYPTMGGGAYTTGDVSQIAGGVPTQPTDPNMPDFMKKAMSGHSAKVVKAIEKKHGSKS
jgi:hypothetical protein